MHSAGDHAHPRGDGGASLVFWLLVTLALTVFAPCMILPAWREYQDADLAERTRARDVDVARQQIDRLERQLNGVRSDPVVIARLARRELRYRLPGDQGLPVAAANGSTGVPLDHLRRGDALRPAEQPLTHRQPPVVVARLARFVPRLNYDALCCERPTREILIAMSLALLAAAFIIFWPRHASR